MLRFAGKLSSSSSSHVSVSAGHAPRLCSPVPQPAAPHQPLISSEGIQPDGHIATTSTVSTFAHSNDGADEKSHQQAWQQGASVTRSSDVALVCEITAPPAQLGAPSAVEEAAQKTIGFMGKQKAAQADHVLSPRSSTDIMSLEGPCIDFPAERSSEPARQSDTNESFQVPRLQGSLSDAARTSSNIPGRFNRDEATSNPHDAAHCSLAAPPLHAVSIDDEMPDIYSRGSFSESRDDLPGPAQEQNPAQSARSSKKPSAGPERTAETECTQEPSHYLIEHAGSLELALIDRQQEATCRDSAAATRHANLDQSGLEQMGKKLSELGEQLCSPASGGIITRELSQLLDQMEAASMPVIHQGSETSADQRGCHSHMAPGPPTPVKTGDEASAAGQSDTGSARTCTGAGIPYSNAVACASPHATVSNSRM